MPPIFFFFFGRTKSRVNFYNWNLTDRETRRFTTVIKVPIYMFIFLLNSLAVVKLFLNSTFIIYLKFIFALGS